ncbi:hypothetical protein EF888_17390 [Silicimonas algicola]|nr:hypothetical protein [Silicimonas algicola]AZQ68743.1 hypothetical protein EF888_17390 [Silicimonas algicola]
MAEMTLTRMRLAEGVWEGLLSARAATVTPRLRIRHRDELVGEPETVAAPAGEGGGPRWLVRFRLPVDRLSDGVQTFVIEDAATGDALAHETVVAGEMLDDDLRAEVSLLRAELDLLKRAFRRHCSEG